MQPITSGEKGNNRKDFLEVKSNEDKWLLADLEGNSLLPQTGFGTTLFFLNSLFDGGIDNQKILDFSHFEPTDEQILKATNLMKVFHEMHGVKEEKTQEIIDAKGVNRLFHATKGMALQVLFSTIANVVGIEPPHRSSIQYQDLPERISQVLQNTNATQVMETTRSLMKIAVRVVRSESNGLCREHKELIEDVLRHIELVRNLRGEDTSIQVPIVYNEIKKKNTPLDRLEYKIQEAWLSDSETEKLGKVCIEKILIAMRR